MRFLSKNARIFVRSRISEKELVRPISSYVDGKEYTSLLTYLQNEFREYKKRGFPYQSEHILEDHLLFKEFIEQFVHPNYVIDFQDIHLPVWVLKAYKKDGPIFLFVKSKKLPYPAIKILNDILATYGMVNGQPKYVAAEIITAL